MKQHELKSGELLNKEGNLNEAGFAYSLVKKYDRSAIKANKLRIKEWDYYYIGDSRFGIALTIADNSYMSMASVSVLDFEAKKDITTSKMGWFTLGKVKLPSSSETGDVFLKGKNYELSFYNNKGKRRLVCKMMMSDKKFFNCDIKLELSSKNSMVIATPFEKSKHFYYNQKINNLVANGYFNYGDLKHIFKEDALAVLDWGRGVWTYKNTWYWSSLNAVQNEQKIGFNLGYGFGDTSKASENMLFVDNEAYKLDDVKFEIPNKNGKEDYLSNWTFTSNDGNINLTFEPLIDRFSDTNVLLIRSCQHQVFGKFSGTIKISDKTFEFNKLVGFAEKVYNKW